ncbi:helix-turn-helix domain-containing protein [Roseovarius rhodophyticola]|uniref:Helix-turn-helix domain-containing protein n=1 Tax=Roseovarius rhodophyticola TaxID=3080827 RepID=A0ABZ2TI12_9RHOB|nr:helix-turn-helix domain-containing protein [Roseovarius sp. W115]MDV2928281.1 helix-turn-helix domain-containing protein [Roseovarius sp. W115]
MYVTTSTNHARFTPPISEEIESHAIGAARIHEGECLYYEGDEVERLYQVLTGAVRLTRLLEDGRRQVIAFGFPGDIIGFPNDGLHQADCDALTDTKLKSFRRSALENGEGEPALHFALLQAALREIHAMQEHFMMLGLKCSDERVASFLVTMLERCGETTNVGRRVFLPMSRLDIADFLGLTVETVSRCFTALRRSGIISLKNSQTVLVRDEAALAAKALKEHD